MDQFYRVYPSYQAAFETFARAGVDVSEAKTLMRRAVELTSGAGAGHRVIVCLGLGPYGATLSPAHEFDGIYPPPFGPKNPTEGFPAIEEVVAHDALVDFHLQRLLVFPEDDATWERIDCIIFETVPLLREAIAIREAMQTIQHRLKESGKPRTSWCISFVFPDGHLPQEGSINASTLIRLMLEGPEESRASDIGINCSEPRLVLDLVRSFTRALCALTILGPKPWLIIYPNGGEGYDPISQSWSSSDPKEPYPAKRWAAEVAQAVGYGLQTKGALGIAQWEGILLGGCCKAGPQHIRALQQLLKRVSAERLHL